MLLALSAPADELDVLCVSVTFGNVEVEKCVFLPVPLARAGNMAGSGYS
jgi:inosine-uridine nucleoside N-ribohydrolase